MSVQIHRCELELPAASKSKVNSGFVAGQLLFGSNVPQRASNVTPHCTETAQQEKTARRGQPERPTVCFGSNRAVLTVRNPFPVYPDNQTFSEAVGMSQSCH